MGKTSKKTGTPKKTWKGNMQFCQNPNCPHDHAIEVQILKGTGACSEDCLRASGVKRDQTIQVIGVTRDELSLLEDYRGRSA